jgi:hypothetical protein
MNLQLPQNKKFNLNESLEETLARMMMTRWAGALKLVVMGKGMNEKKKLRNYFSCSYSSILTMCLD